MRPPPAPGNRPDAAMPTNDPASHAPDRSPWEAWSLWLAVGYAALLLLAALAVASGWTALEDTLDPAHWFR